MWLKSFLKKSIEKVKRYKYPILVLLVGFITWWWNCLPDKLFDAPTCTILLDKDGNLLSAQIADDGQWRFPETKKVPLKFRQCIVQFEDRDFYSHCGFSVKAMVRATKQNVSAWKVVSGGSTLTMQLSKLVRGNHSRTLWEKFMEIFYATRMEWSYSKEEILAMYASHAPFGGNVVGLDAAAWRYFGRSADQLSWAESATLAVLPNAPSLIYPGKNQERLIKKRNRLLNRLKEVGIIDGVSYELALTEPIPQKPYPLPRAAQHLLQKAIEDGYKGQVIKTTIDVFTQRGIQEILDHHHEKLSMNAIHNAATIVISVNTGEVVAYVGNTKDDSGENGSDVDVITAPRSTGSILKPLLYANMLQDGKLMPKMLVPDVPTQIGGYSPKNFNPGYEGAIYADKALSRSLNIPAVRMLNEYGIEKFHRNLKTLGLSTLNKPASNYGLSLILGGAEATLWDLVSVYAIMARTLKQQPDYNADLKNDPHYIFGKKEQGSPGIIQPPFDPAVIYTTFEAMVEVNRPDADANWKSFSSSGKVAWKTGTSFGFRDGWAIGITPGYVVGVWVGNADGEGRPGITGIQAAAPILFDAFSKLPQTGWFRIPDDNMTKVLVCRRSGHRASENCETLDSVLIPNTCLRTTACPYHQIIHLDKKGKYRVDSECASVDEMKHQSYFVLPPIMEKYYKYHNPSYVSLPPFGPDCSGKQNEKPIYVVYPKKNSKIKIPIQQDGSLGRTVFEVVHRRTDAVLHWHLDDTFIGSTKEFHQVELAPAPGHHTITLVDQDGVSIKQEFDVIGTEEEEGL